MAIGFSIDASAFGAASMGGASPMGDSVDAAPSASVRLRAAPRVDVFLGLAVLMVVPSSESDMQLIGGREELPQRSRRWIGAVARNVMLVDMLATGCDSIETRERHSTTSRVTGCERRRCCRRRQRLSPWPRHAETRTRVR